MRLFDRRMVIPATLLALLLAAGVLAAHAPVSAAVTLPSKIGDAEFWQLIVDLSEPDGEFPFDNFVSNEVSLQSIIPALLERTDPGGAYLGVGPEQNFTYIAALRPRIAFIIDIRRQNLVEHLMYKALFELSDDRADFVSRLFSRKRPTALDARSSAAELFRAFDAAPADRTLFDANLRAVIDTLTRRHHFPLGEGDRTRLAFVYTSFFREGPGLNYSVGGGPSVNMPTYAALMSEQDGTGQHRSYLADERNYEIVRKLQASNLVIPVVGDFAGPTAIREVGRYLTTHRAPVTAFYLSNVERYLFEQRRAWRRFYANVAILPYDDRSLFIRSVLHRPTFELRHSLSPIAGLMKAFGDGRIRRYHDAVTIAN
jgi:hypothetical protein